MSRSESSAAAPLSRFIPWALLATICLIAVGCGSSDWGYVEGVVTLKGEPIGPGTLIFEPADPELTRSGMAHFNQDGVYEVKSAGNKAGIPIGEYRVRVIAQGEEEFGDEHVGPPPPSAIPNQYLNYGAELKASVSAGSNTINFELES